MTAVTCQKWKSQYFSQFILVCKTNWQLSHDKSEKWKVWNSHYRDKSLAIYSSSTVLYLATVKFNCVVNVILEIHGHYHNQSNFVNFLLYIFFYHFLSKTIWSISWYAYVCTQTIINVINYLNKSLI